MKILCKCYNKWSTCKVKVVFNYFYLLCQALISRVVAARNEVMQKGHTPKQAEQAKDAFAKVRHEYL